jgi:hypothetical protein
VKKSKYNGEKNEKCDIIIKYEEETWKKIQLKRAWCHIYYL